MCNVFYRDNILRYRTPLYIKIAVLKIIYEHFLRWYIKFPDMASRKCAAEDHMSHYNNCKLIDIRHIKIPKSTINALVKGRGNFICEGCLSRFAANPPKKPRVLDVDAIIESIDSLDKNDLWGEVNWLFNVTINDISVIHVTAHRCADGLKK